jgi:hypothetical protein
LCRYDVRRRSACGNHSGLIVKTIPGCAKNRSPSKPESLSPSARNPVHLAPERFSRSARNRVHLAPESPFKKGCSDLPCSLGGVLRLRSIGMLRPMLPPHHAADQCGEHVQVVESTHDSVTPGWCPFPESPFFLLIVACRTEAHCIREQLSLVPHTTHFVIDRATRPPASMWQTEHGSIGIPAGGPAAR